MYEYNGKTCSLETENFDLFNEYISRFLDREKESVREGFDPGEDDRYTYSFSGQSNGISSYDKKLFFDHINAIVEEEAKTKKTADCRGSYGFRGLKYIVSTSVKKLLFDDINDILEEERSLEQYDEKNNITFQLDLKDVHYFTTNRDLFVKHACELLREYALSPKIQSEKEYEEENENASFGIRRTDPNEEPKNMIIVSFHDENKDPDDQLGAILYFRKNIAGDKIEIERFVQTPRRYKKQKLFFCGGEWGNPPPTSRGEFSIEEFCEQAEELVSDLAGENRLDKRYREELFKEFSFFEENKD